MFKIKPIKTEEDYERAIVQLRKLKLRNAAKDTEEYNFREVLKVLITNFEKENYPFEQDNFEQWVDFLQQNNNSEKKLKEISDSISKETKFEEKRISLIKQRLKEKFLKQKDLVNIIGVDKSYVSQLMNGKKKFTVPIISKLYHYLDIPYELLIPPADSFACFRKNTRLK